MDIQVRGREPTSMRDETPGESGGGGKGGGGMSPEKVKIIIAAALLLLAGVALAWNFGLFGDGRPDQVVSPIFESEEEAEQAWEEAQRERARTHPPERSPPPSGS